MKGQKWDGAQKAKIILREKPSDGRAKNPILTKKGSDILQKAIPLVETKDAEFFQNLIGDELSSMIDIFRKLVMENQAVLDGVKTGT